MTLKTYGVTVTLSVDVEAESAEEAEQLAHDYVGVVSKAPKNIEFNGIDSVDVWDY